MHAPPHSGLLHPIGPVDLSAIDAVGFDLDHTLALYDDEAVNRLAADETVRTLTSRGHAPAALPLEITATAARGLSMDLRYGNVLKIGADGRVRIARRGTAWLSDDEIAAQYDAYNPADEATTWHVHSPFDAPTLWFFSALGAGIRAPGDTAFAARVLQDIRTCLDESHTRGQLKRHIARDLARFVEPAGSVRAGLERWKHDGKRLFVITNSDRAFATKILAHVVGPAWMEIFDLVVTDAAKPRFFAAPAVTRDAGAPHDGSTHVLDRADASQVEARLGVAPERILYAGDNARADIIPARRRGWKTLHVVAEMAAPPGTTPWAGALAHDGAPTWFAKTIFDHADLACARIDALLALGPRTSLLPGGEHFYHRIAHTDRTQPPQREAP